MSERTSTTALPSTTTEVHATDMECDDIDLTTVFRAVCPCGYASRAYPRKQAARRAGTAHERSYAEAGSRSGS